MFRSVGFLFGLLLVLALPAWSDSLAQKGLSPSAQKITQLLAAGVDESVVLTYIRTWSEPPVTADDLVMLKAAGVSGTLLQAASSSGARSRYTTGAPVSEAQLYRLFLGTVYHEGGAYEASNGLPNSMKLELESDSQVLPYIRGFSSQNDTARLYNWSGLGLVVGGLLYSGISYSVSPENATLNNTIGFSAVGIGVLSSIIGNVLEAGAFQKLYDGLYQYNRDLLDRASGGNS